MATADLVLPKPFLERLAQIVPPEAFEATLATFVMPQATGFRVNTLRATPKDVLKELEAAGLPMHAVAWKEDAFWVEASDRPALLQTAAFLEGRVYVQNLSSMIPPLVLEPQPGERVLDLTAAPGSKTLQIASQMRQEGELAAVEVVKSRFFKLRDNLAAQGATQVRTFLQDGTKVWRYRPEHFDRVLLDAPCSTEGRFRVEDPETFAFWSLRKVREMAHKQLRLLYSGIQCLRPGGVLVYSTCSFAPEENEAILDKTLRKFGKALHLEPLDLSLENMCHPLTSWEGRSFQHDLTAARRILPTQTMEGFFVAKLRKLEPTIP